jgi:orotate phosphoribosyltransferase
MTREELAKEIFIKSNIKGDFILRSGKRSNEYFDKYLFQSDPKLLNEIALHMMKLIPENTNAIAGLELGAIAIAAMLSQVSGIRTLFVRKKSKEYGTCKIIEGGELKDKNIVIIEDIVTTGGQILLSAKDLINEGAKIIKIISVIDKETGGKENLTKENYKYEALFTMSEVKKSAGVI